MRNQFLILGTLLLASLAFNAAHAADDVKGRAEAGLGYTDNVFLIKDDKKSDFYLDFAGGASLKRNDHELGFRLGYTDFFEQNAADVFTWKLSDRFKTQGSAWRYYGALLGQVYPNGNLGTTESAFNMVGLDLKGERSHGLSARSTLYYGGGYKLRYFTSFNGRNDHTFFGTAEIQHEASRKLLLSGRSELGLAISSLAEYSNLYLEMAGTADYEIDRQWYLFGELGYRGTQFTSRSVSTATFVSTRRGVRVRSGTENEAYSMLFFSVEGVRKFNETARASIGLSDTMQSSKSGYEDYSALVLIGKLIFDF